MQCDAIDICKEMDTRKKNSNKNACKHKCKRHWQVKRATNAFNSVFYFASRNRAIEQRNTKNIVHISRHQMTLQIVEFELSQCSLRAVQFGWYFGASFRMDLVWLTFYFRRFSYCCNDNNGGNCIDTNQHNNIPLNGMNKWWYFFENLSSFHQSRSEYTHQARMQCE